MESNQLFQINQIIDKDKIKKGESSYIIQYGFPSSGSVILNFDYVPADKACYITETRINVPPADKDFDIMLFSQKNNMAK